MEFHRETDTWIKRYGPVRQTDLNKAQTADRFHCADKAEVAHAQLRAFKRFGINKKAGVIDPKGQVEIHIKAVGDPAAEGKLPTESVHIDLAAAGKRSLYGHVKSNNPIDIGVGYVVVNIIQPVQNVAQRIKVINGLPDFRDKVACRAVFQEPGDNRIIPVKITQRHALGSQIRYKLTHVVIRHNR